MVRLASMIAALCLGACAYGSASVAEPLDMTAPIDLSTPEAAVYSMIRAMYQGDGEMVDQIFLPGAELRRVSADGEVRPDAFQRWRDWVAGLEVGHAHEELFDVTTEEFGHLATVWAPFVISVGGELAGCGVNTLTLTKVDGDWRVIFAMDSQAPEGTCEELRKAHAAP
ncbi:MAG: hypothetical protein AAF216_07105 [Pseudomonadota bacterium]